MKMKTGQYQSTTTTYHWVTPLPENITHAELNDLYAEIWEWCTKTFGPPGTWSSKTWMGSNSRYYFVKESDRLLFILRWS